MKFWKIVEFGFGICKVLGLQTNKNEEFQFKSFDYLNFFIWILYNSPIQFFFLFPLFYYFPFIHVCFFKVFGWGWSDVKYDESKLAMTVSMLENLWDTKLPIVQNVPELKDVHLDPPRFSLPHSISQFCSSSKYDRCFHTFGKSYLDLVR